MTAIAGLWSHIGAVDSADRCRRMLDAQRVHAPGREAIWDSADGIAIGRRLFATLPEDAHDRGPVVAGGGRYVLVADVRLDNRDALAEMLGLDVGEAARLADVAFVAAAWERWGEACLSRLYGDYAVAVWDRAERCLTLARDPLGGRPLHYHCGGRMLAFASMPKGLHALPEIPYAPDEDHVAEFLALLPEVGAATFYRDICRVEPGHAVRFFAHAQPVSRRFWMPARRADGPRTMDQAIEGMREQVDRAVATRLRGGGGRVGAHLSAGLDSAAVSATAARLLGSGGQVVAFTAVPRDGFDGEAGRIADEGPLAAATAALYPNLRHRLVRPEGLVTDDWDRDFHLLERPILNSFNQHWANAINAEARREGVSVLLTGAMGNATISYAGGELLPELFERGRWLLLFRIAHQMVGAGAMRWRGVLLTAIGHRIPVPLWDTIARLRQAPDAEIASYSLVHPGRIRALGLENEARARGALRPHPRWGDSIATRLWHLLRFDVGNYQKAALGGWGVDLRDPTADRRLIEYCLSVPTEYFVADGEPRSLARRAFADRLPGAVTGERRRGYQSADWLEHASAARASLREEIVRLRAVRSAVTALDLDRAEALIARWPDDEAEEMARPAHRLALMRGMASGHFLRKAERSNH